MLSEEKKYYLDNKDSLLKKYNGRYIVIKNREVIGDYGSDLEAVKETSKVHEMGTFLVQKCDPNDTGNVQTFHSRVSFA